MKNKIPRLNKADVVYNALETQRLLTIKIIAREIAEKLFSSFSFLLFDDTGRLIKGDEGKKARSFVKRCATITVENIFDHTGGNKQYWELVKEEIQKL